MARKGFLGRLDDRISHFFDDYNVDYAESQTRSLITFLRDRGYTETVGLLEDALTHMIKEHHDPARHDRHDAARASYGWWKKNEKSS